MIEQGIYFALGCIVTALGALAFAPLFWRRALRLTRRRLQLQVPLSMREILAERDQLRAEFAVERLRIEQAMERVQAGKGADLMEIGRRSMATTALAEDLAQARAVAERQDLEIAGLSRDVAESLAESGAMTIALHDAHVRLERSERETAQLDAESQRLYHLAEGRRTTIASLETRAMGLEMRLTDTQRANVLREQSLAESMRGKLESAVAQAARHETSGLSLRREIDETKTKIRALEPLVGERDAQIKMHDGIVAMLRSEIVSLQNGLEVARRQKPMSDAESDGGLRESIHALGLAVATMTREARLKAKGDDRQSQTPAGPANDPAGDSAMETAQRSTERALDVS